MGNIYFEQRKFPAAIKMYRMALDQVPPADRSARMRMLRNIAIAFIKLGQYQVCLQSQVHGRRSLLCGISCDACPAAWHLTGRKHQKMGKPSACRQIACALHCKLFQHCIG